MTAESAGCEARTGSRPEDEDAAIVEDAKRPRQRGSSAGAAFYDPLKEHGWGSRVLVQLESGHSFIGKNSRKGRLPDDPSEIPSASVQ